MPPARARGTSRSARRHRRRTTPRPTGPVPDDPTWGGSQQRTDLCAEPLHLLDELVRTAAREAHLQMVDPDLAPLTQRVGDLLGRAGHGRAGQVPRRGSDVQPLANATDVAAVVTTFTPVELDERGHLVQRCPLGQPAVGEPCRASYGS